LTNSSLRQILHLELSFPPYKKQVAQQLNANGKLNRIHFCRQMQEFTQDSLVLDVLLMSHEANFHVLGFVNKQNFRYWSNMNPRNPHDRPLHPEKVVRCAIGAECVIGPYFIEPYFVII
ncbi:hypothetical protein C0J52_28433, partial [Blattella germanica]